MNSLLHFPRNWFQLHHSKICKKLKNALFKSSEHSGFTGLLWKHFLKCLPWTMINFGFKDFWTLDFAFTVSGFNFMAQKCTKNWKLPSRFSSTFTLDLKVVSKQFSRMFSMSDFGFTQSCLAFPKNIFNLFTEKCAKKSIFKRSEHLTSR